MVNANGGQSSDNSNSFCGARSRLFNYMHQFTSKQGMRNGRLQPYTLVAAAPAMLILIFCVYTHHGKIGIHDLDERLLSFGQI